MRGWNGTLVHHIFQPEEANIITRILISQFGAIDRIIWLHSKTGMFSIGSAYHLETERSSRRSRESSNGNQAANHWKVLWNLKVSDSVKHFMWQAFHNILPTRLNMVQRKVIDKVDA